MDIFADFKLKTVPKGTILLHSGEVCNAAYNVKKGCLKSYVIDKAGKEHILQFAPEGWVISDMDSFINQKPTVVFIDAIEDSEVVPIPKSMQSNLENIEKEVIIELNSKLFNNLIASNKRLIALLSASAEERYQNFIQTYPTLVQRLPLKLIASYIGITPEYLSEIRRKIARR
jgi:CRP-like cAMP-binding protein